MLNPKSQPQSQGQKPQQDVSPQPVKVNVRPIAPKPDKTASVPNILLFQTTEERANKLYAEFQITISVAKTAAEHCSTPYSRERTTTKTRQKCFGAKI